MHFAIAGFDFCTATEATSKTCVLHPFICVFCFIYGSILWYEYWRIQNVCSVLRHSNCICDETWPLLDITTGVCRYERYIDTVPYCSNRHECDNVYSSCVFNDSKLILCVFEHLVLDAPQHLLLFFGCILIAAYSIMLVAKAVSKQIVLLILPGLYCVFPVELRRIWQPPVHTTCKLEDIRDVRMRILPHNEDGHAWDIVTTARFISYASMAWGLSEVFPRLLCLLKW